MGAALEGMFSRIGNDFIAMVRWSIEAAIQCLSARGKDEVFGVRRLDGDCTFSSGIGSAPAG
jgi:hypothetical protein